MTIEEKFLIAEKQSEANFIRVSEGHPTNLYVGMENGQRCLLLVIDGKPPEPYSYSSLEIQVRKRVDGNIALVVSLKKRDLAELFGRLVEDLIRSTCNEPSSEKAALIILKRISWWNRLFEKSRSALMSELELRGFIAELFLLNSRLIPKYGVEAAICSWKGPLGSSKDFRLPDVDIEVKSIHSDASEVRISSLEQLEVSLNPLFLCTIELENADRENADFSVGELVAAVRNACGSSEKSVELFEEAIGKYGYFYLPDYDEIYFRFGDLSFFEVIDGFPRLTRADAPHGIGSCQYEISIASLSDYRRAE